MIVLRPSVQVSSTPRETATPRASHYAFPTTPRSTLSSPHQRPEPESAYGAPSHSQPRMIALLTGRIEQLSDSACVIDVNGVGYLVQASTRTLSALPQPPATARLLIETHVREDAILLYGFADPAERDWFRLLTTVQGVGGKVALSVLSALSPRDLVGAIAAGDRASLTRAPGVGPRLAVRLLTELREKAGAMPSSAPGLAMPVGRAAGIAEDAVSALTNLGYRRPEALPAVARVVERLGDGAALDAVIREALKELAQRVAG
jgi:holliday junction DNA helicase RuvA